MKEKLQKINPFHKKPKVYTKQDDFVDAFAPPVANSSRVVELEASKPTIWVNEVHQNRSPQPQAQQPTLFQQIQQERDRDQAQQQQNREQQLREQIRRQREFEDQEIQQQRLIEEQLRKAKLEKDTVARAERENRMLYERQEQQKEEERTFKRRHNASAGSVRHLRGLIREKYRLDLYVWEMREVQEEDRDIIEADCTKADRILQEIYFIVNLWEEDLFDAEEWKVAKKIKESLTLKPEEHAVWGALKPWDREDRGK